MGNVVDFRRCESLDQGRQRLTEAERERLDELFRTTTDQTGEE